MAWLLSYVNKEIWLARSFMLCHTIAMLCKGQNSLLLLPHWTQQLQRWTRCNSAIACNIARNRFMCPVLYITFKAMSKSAWSSHITVLYNFLFRNISFVMEMLWDLYVEQGLRLKDLKGSYRRKYIAQKKCIEKCLHIRLALICPFKIFSSPLPPKMSIASPLLV